MKIILLNAEAGRREMRRVNDKIREAREKTRK